MAKKSLALIEIMRRLGSISTPIARRLRTHSRNPNSLSQTLKNSNLIDPNRSRRLHSLIQRPDPSVPNRPWSHSSFARESTSTHTQEKKVVATERVSAIVDEIAQLTLLETMDLTEVLREKLGVEEMPSMGIMMPGMGLSVQGGGRGGKGAGGAKAAEEAKAEKTAFDLKLDGFDAAAKIKIIKEVRTFTDLGLKEAKDLVEKAPTLLKKGVPKEEAEKIIEKMKELGAKVSME